MAIHRQDPKSRTMANCSLVGVDSVAPGIAKLFAKSSRGSKVKPKGPRKPATAAATTPTTEQPKSAMADRPKLEVMEEIRGKPMGEPLVVGRGNYAEADYEAMSRFLAEYSKIGNASKASRIVGIVPTTHKRWLEKEPKFRKLFEEAREEAADYLEFEAWRRAVQGVDKPIFHQGVVVTTVKEYSDGLLTFLLRGSRPEKYRDRVEHTVKGEITFRPKVAMFAQIAATVNRFRARIMTKDLSEDEQQAIAAALASEEHNGNGHRSNGNGNGIGGLLEDKNGSGNGDHGNG